jgi:hypothetical protein
LCGGNQGEKFLTQIVAQQTDGIVRSARREGPAVRSKCDGPDCVIVAFKASQLLAAGHVPETDGVVIRARRGSSVVRRKSDGRYRTGDAKAGENLSNVVVRRFALGPVRQQKQTKRQNSKKDSWLEPRLFLRAGPTQMSVNLDSLPCFARTGCRANQSAIRPPVQVCSRLEARHFLKM